MSDSPAPRPAGGEPPLPAEMFDAVVEALARLVEAECPYSVTGGEHRGRCEYQSAAQIVRFRLPGLLRGNTGVGGSVRPVGEAAAVTVRAWKTSLGGVRPVVGWVDVAVHEVRQPMAWRRA